MVSFDIAFDNSDSLLGGYFERSKEDIVSYILDNSRDHSITEIPTNRCNIAYIDLRICQVNASNFVFLAYSHGNSDSLVAAGDYYVKKEVNTTLFANSLFYSMCCLSGRELGHDLISKGCHGFIGFTEEANALLGKNEQMSIECDNYGIKRFIDGNSLGECFLMMKNNFTTYIDLLVTSGDPLTASYLLANRESLIVSGNQTLVFGDFVK